MEKNYKEPKFELVRTDGLSRVFFAASGTPSAPAPKATLGSMNSDSVTPW